MLIVMLAALASAQDAALSETVKKAEEVEKPKTTLSAELGGALAAGNTAAYNVRAGVAGSHKWTANQFTFGIGGLYGQSVADGDGDGLLSNPERDVGYVTNQQQATADVRYDRFFGPKNSLYFLAGALIDPYAGYDSRTHEQIGYSRMFVKTDEMKLLGEIGFDWAQENYVAGVEPNYRDIFAGRAMVGFKYVFNEAVSFEDTLEVYPNVIDLEDVRVNNAASLSAKLSDKLGFKTSYNIRFDNVPVTPAYRKTDHALTASLVVTVL
jgi:putative salt-induced outer membrane protein YdiY